MLRPNVSWMSATWLQPVVTPAADADDMKILGIPSVDGFLMLSCNNIHSLAFGNILIFMTWFSETSFYYS